MLMSLKFISPIDYTLHFLIKKNYFYQQKKRINGQKQHSTKTMGSDHQRESDGS